MRIETYSSLFQIYVNYIYELRIKNVSFSFIVTYEGRGYLIKEWVIKYYISINKSN